MHDPTTNPYIIFWGKDSRKNRKEALTISSRLIFLNIHIYTLNHNKGISTATKQKELKYLK
jgi:hypothetical protein